MRTIYRQQQIEKLWGHIGISILVPRSIFGDLKLMLQRVFKRAYCSGLALYECGLEALAEEAQYNLFRNSLSDNHCLHTS